MQIYVENNWNKNQTKIQTDLLTHWFLHKITNYPEQRKYTYQVHLNDVETLQYHMRNYKMEKMQMNYNMDNDLSKEKQ